MIVAHKDDWRVHLDSLVYERLNAPFRWGSNDCALFAADAVQATTGVDFAAKLRGYRTAREALRIISARGGLVSIATRALGAALAPIFACTGDIALVPSSRGSKRVSLAVCLSCDKAAVPGAMGLQIVPIDRALCVWRVG